jgi:nucleotide-binding universal stress UspA family protein
MTMFKTIVVATDGSEHGSQALTVGRAMAAESGAHLTVVHVTELVGGKGGVYPAAADEQDIRERIAEQVAQLRRDGLTVDAVTPTVRSGGPAHAIAEVAEAANADLIVVGSRGHSLIKGVVLGGVPIRLLQIAHRPVMVVPASD